MQRRRFLLTAASAAMTAPLVGLAGCGDGSSGPHPKPVPPSDVVLRLPRDMYLHPGAPTEWWWHTGTLRSGDRIFGFEINAASFAESGFGFTQVMLTDVQENRHYQSTTPVLPPTFDPATWAESDDTKDWYARLADVSMEAPAEDPTRNMTVRALLHDERQDVGVSFDLLLSQVGRPFFVWGTGQNPGSSGGLQTSNFYFSLTRLHASGEIVVAGETFPVTGVTWMDHEYGAFGTPSNPVKWILQDMQFDNGYCISNSGSLGSGHTPRLGEPFASDATVQDPNGAMYYVPSSITPSGRTWTSPQTGRTYFMELYVEIPSFDASFVVTSLVDAQEFPVPDSPIYEGVATARGTFRSRTVSGTAWNEQRL